MFVTTTTVTAARMPRTSAAWTRHYTVGAEPAKPERGPGSDGFGWAALGFALLFGSGVGFLLAAVVFAAPDPDASGESASPVG